MPEIPKRTEPPPGPEKKPVPVPKWYELERLVPHRDMVLVVGFLAFATGVFLLPVVGTPAGLMVVGAGLMFGAWRILLP